MAQKEHIDWHTYVAFTTGLIAVLAAIASFQASGFSSQMLEEKNNAILLQSKANKEWNHYLAADITNHILKTFANNQEQMTFQNKALDLENQVIETTSKSNTYFKKNSSLSTAGTFFEIAIALSSMSILVKRKSFWIFSFLLAGIGIYFLRVGFL